MRNAELQSEMAAIGKEIMRTVFLDYDARRVPKTERFCMRCQKDIQPGQAARLIRVLEINGAPMVLHPEDAGEKGIDWIVDEDCARKIGWDFTRPENRKDLTVRKEQIGKSDAIEMAIHGKLPPSQQAAYDQIKIKGEVMWSSTTPIQARALNALVEKGLVNKVGGLDASYKLERLA